MPRLKTPELPFASVRRLLIGYELDSVHLAQALGVSRKTGKHRLDHPEELTLDDLRKICRNTRVPADEIREAIRF